jgi:class 3 adenylate cyclase/tetratricopeptide (TPR) repeat protein
VTGAAAHASRGERKFAVAFFADLSGYTALCQRLDPEDVELTIRPLMTALRVSVEAHGGTIANVAGDGFFAIFGVPVAMEDAPARAARAAHALRQLVAARNEDASVPPVPEVHIGVAAGELLVTPSDDPPGWSVIGSAINLASRLCDLAGPGQALFDDQCRFLTGAEAEWAGSRQLQVHGHDRDVRVWELGKPSRELRRSYEDIPFTNRHDVLHQLDEIWRSAVADGRSKVVHIAGEAGLGKSRVVSHWLASQTAVRHVWLRCGEYVTGQPLLRLLDMLVDLSGEPSTDVRSLLDAPHTSTSRVAYRANPFPMVMAITRRLLASVAVDLPLVIVVDDLHSADASLVELIANLRVAPVDARLLVLCTQRTGETEGDLPSDIHLQPLPISDTEAILAGALGAAPPQQIRDAVVSRVAGHPLMAVQTAAYLLEAGLVSVTDGVCKVESAPGVTGLPTSLRLFVSARLDRLPRAEKAVLQDLSAFGNDTDDAWITMMLGARASEMLPSLAARGMLSQDESGRWRFCHGLVQEVAYASLTRRARGDLHQRQLARLGSDAAPELRAYHATAWAESLPAAHERDHEAGIAALVETFRFAQILYATQARSAHLTIGRVRRLLDDRAPDAPDLAVRILVLDAQCLIEIGDFDEALRAVSRAESIADQATIESSTRLSNLLARGHALSRLRRFQGARQALDEAASLAESLGDDSSRAQALRLMAETWRHSVFTRFISLTEDAHSLFTAADDAEGAGECARLLAYLFSPASPALYDRWSEIAARATPISDLRGQARLARNSANALCARFAYVESVAAAERSIELGELAGTGDAVTAGLLTLVQASVSTGNLDAAFAAAARLIAMADAQANPRMRIAAGATAALVLHRRGATARAAEELRVAKEGVAEFGASELGDVAFGEAVTTRDSGHWGPSFDHFHEMRTAAEENGFALFSLAARTQQARLQIVGAARSRGFDLTGLVGECRDVDSPLLLSYAEALADLARVQAGDASPLSDPVSGACLEELAIRADTTALRAELIGEDPAPLWLAARDLWQRLGYTIWLARAQARTGDLEAAQHTLEVLDSPDDARAWALSQRTG